MLKQKQYQGVTVFKMGRSIGRATIYPVHSFLVNDVLVDTGTPFAQREFLKKLKERKVTKIINTHFHEDHIGNNRAIQKMFNADIYAHKESLPFISDPRKNYLRLYQRLTWKLPEKSRAKPIGDEILSNGYRLKVIESKGHSIGGVFLYEEDKKWLFTGDMFCGIKNIYQRSDENFNGMLNSLKSIARLNIDAVFCGLKGVIPDGGQALKRKVEFMGNLKQNTEKLYKEGVPPVKIKKQLLGREDMMFIVSGGHFSKQNIINSIVEDI